ncbi:MAG: AAA family ATPase, partial [Deltaproteobacteria bacterium]|nr:AAA family ATPase [Deltaproteobacteria bacterium]
SGGQTEKIAHLPELRFALGEPGIDTTSIDNAASALDTRSFFIRKVGVDGFRIGYKPKLNKVVSDRRASLDEETDVRPEVRRLVDREFERGATLPLVRFPADSSDIPDSPRLMVVTANPEWEWSAKSDIRARIAEWTRQRGAGHRLYPGAIVWCVRRPGRELRDKVELVLAWRRVNREVTEGTLGSEFDRADLADIKAKAADAEDAAKEEVWAEYRYVILSDNSEPDGLKIIDLGAGHSSSNETLCGRVVQALRQESLLSESVGAGYLDRNWPPALEASGAWPLSSLRQAFVNGVLTRLLDPEKVLRTKTVEFVERGDFGLASGRQPDGTFDRVWFAEAVAPDEVTFDADVFLLKKATAARVKNPPQPVIPARVEPGVQQPITSIEATTEPAPQSPESPVVAGSSPVLNRTLRLFGSITPEVWNRFGTRVIPKLRTGSDLKLRVELSVTVDSQGARQLELDLRQAIDDIGLTESVRVEEGAAD